MTQEDMYDHLAGPNDHHAGCGYGDNRCPASEYQGDAALIKALRENRDHYKRAFLLLSKTRKSDIRSAR